MSSRHCACAIFILPAASAAADRAAVPGRVTYDAAFYAAFAPRTALDMVNQTPGFVLVEGADRRGFSGATGNVLVDGEHPVAKSQTLTDILGRIPAAQVVRIELLRGGDAGGDSSHFALVANVVRTAASGQGFWQAGAEYAGRTPMPNGVMSWTGRLGRTDYGLGMNGYSLRRLVTGERRLLDGQGLDVGTKQDLSPRSFYEIALNGEASRPMLGGRTRITGQFYRSHYREESQVTSFGPTGGESEGELDPYGEGKRSLEAGFSHERRLGGWEFELSGLATRTGFDSRISAIHRTPAAGVDSTFSQRLERHSGETILRAAISGAVSPSHRLEGGMEVALNSLGQRLALTLDLGAGAFPILVPNANLEVAERRGEAYLVDRWTISRRWSLETRITGELSRLGFAGDTKDSVSLAYLKPSLQLTRALGRRNQLRLRLDRDVGQLDFANFVSSASLTDDLIKGGNPELRPERSWRLEGTADLRFGTDGAVALTLFRYWIANVVDLVPAGPPGAQFAAPGNIGHGMVEGAQLTFRLPLRPLIRGGTFTFDGTWRHSRVTDPLTHERRAITAFDPITLKAEFRQDLAKLKSAWGASYAGKPVRRTWRLDEVETRRESPNAELWAETSALKGLKLKATIGSLLAQDEVRERRFYSPDRRGSLVRVERSRRDPGRLVQLSLSGNF